MVVSLVLTPVRPEGEVEYEDSSMFDTSSEGDGKGKAESEGEDEEGEGEDEGPSNVWSYGSASFQDLKG